MYIKVKDNKALGFVKVGERKLFFHDYVTIKIFRQEPSRSYTLQQFWIFMCTSLAKELELENRYSKNF